MGDCDGAMQSEQRWLFPVTDFDVVSMVPRQDLTPLFKTTFPIFLLKYLPNDDVNMHGRSLSVFNGIRLPILKSHTFTLNL